MRLCPSLKEAGFTAVCLELAGALSEPVMMLARVGEQIGLAYALENVIPRAASRCMFGVSYSAVPAQP